MLGCARSVALVAACVALAACAAPLSHEAAGEKNDLGAAGAGAASASSAVLGTRPRRIELARIEGGGDPSTGELWSRLVRSSGSEHLAAGVAVNAQALAGGVPGYCGVTVASDGDIGSNPPGTFEYYTSDRDGSTTPGDPNDNSSFVPDDCYGRLDESQQDGIHDALFQGPTGVGCALQNVGNFTSNTYAHVYLDVDAFQGEEALQTPYGPPYTTGTVPTPPGRNAPDQVLGLWDYGMLMPGQSKAMWIYFKNGAPTAFTFTGSLVGEVVENCGPGGTGNGMDEDCDGVDDNGCGAFAFGEPCFHDDDCAVGKCQGELITSGFGAAGDEVDDDVAGTCGYCPAGTIDVNGDDSLCAPIAQLSSGGTHSCARTTLGTLYCWGNNTGGRLGDGSVVLRTLPTLVSGGYTDWAQVAVGGDFSCGLRAGRIYCWGTNFNGQLGDATTMQRTAPTLVSGGHTDWSSVSAGNGHACGIRAGGLLYCWGYNVSGQLGDGLTTSRSTPGLVSGVYTDWSSVSAGHNHSCAIRAGIPFCWGNNGSSQLGDGSTIQRLTPQPVNTPDTDWSSVSAGNSHSCGIRNGRAYCWGYNILGALGDGTSSTRSTPTLVSGGYTAWSSVSAGENHSCGVSGGIAYCWGYNFHAQLGDGTTTVLRNTPTAVGGGLTDWSSVEVGNNHSCGVHGGRARCWGNPFYGQLGDGTISVRPMPAMIGTDTDWTLGDAGDYHVCGLRGTVAYCWGDNGSGRMGNGSIAGSATPALVSGGFTDWSALRAGTSHSCGLRSGLAYCWGANLFGQLGNGSTSSQNTPQLVSGGYTTWSDLSTFGDHTCGIAGGVLYCWGYNSYGQVGDGTNTARNVPTLVLGGLAPTAVATGAAHSCVISAGLLYCWGYNFNGQLGNGSTTNSTSPVLVSGGFVDWTSVTAGDNHTCAIRGGGLLYCWGSNGTYRLGDGTLTQRTTPNPVSGGFSDWTSVDGGAAHTCALRAGRIYCWGANGSGQLGDGSTDQRSVPAVITGDYSDWTSVRTGDQHTCGVRGGALYCWGNGQYGQLGPVPYWSPQPIRGIYETLASPYLSHVVDNPVGDPVESVMATGLVLRTPTIERRGYCEFDVSEHTLQSIGYAHVTGGIGPNNSLDTGIRTMEISVYAGDGTLTVGDWAPTVTPVGTFVYNPPYWNKSFDYDALTAVQALLDAGATSIGVRVRSTVDDAANSFYACDLVIGTP